MKTPPSLSVIKLVMQSFGYAVFAGKSGYDLNIIGIRSSEDAPEIFNDWITVSYIQNGQWAYFAFPATTDPGTFYRENMINVAGTAVLKPGQYRSAFTFGKHRNKYYALVQRGDVTVYRDADANATLDLQYAPTESGLFGINIHRADAHEPSQNVGKWSAGCQVFQDPDHFDFFLKLCSRSASLYGDSFTYTLVTEEQLKGVEPV